jgi:flavin-binding protein dodecin
MGPFDIDRQLPDRDCRLRPLVRPAREVNMTNHVYKKVELVGSSKTSVTDAIETAISRASKTMRNLDWFEVDQIRGHIKDGSVEHYQVSMKVGFRIDD